MGALLLVGGLLATTAALLRLGEARMTGGLDEGAFALVTIPLLVVMLGLTTVGLRLLIRGALDDEERGDDG